MSVSIYIVVRIPGFLSLLCCAMCFTFLYHLAKVLKLGVGLKWSEWITLIYHCLSYYVVKCEQYFPSSALVIFSVHHWLMKVPVRCIRVLRNAMCLIRFHFHINEYSFVSIYEIHSGYDHCLFSREIKK